MSSKPTFPTLMAAVETAKVAAVSRPYLAAISLVVVVYITHSYLAYARLRHFPGPRLARWTRIPYILWHAGAEVHIKFGDINETYGMVPPLIQSSRWLSNQSGPIAVVAPGVLLTSDVELMRRMAAPRSKYKRNVWYMAFRFNPDRDHIGCERDNEAHGERKMKLAPGVTIPYIPPHLMFAY